MLEWNVYCDDFNERKIRIFNVFNHHGVIEDLKKFVKKYKTKEEFCEHLRTTIMYYYWSKCEWEIVLTSFPERQDYTEEKIDVYDQLMLNWDKFCDYVWDNKSLINKL